MWRLVSQLRVAVISLAILVLALLQPQAASAQERGSNEPGRFDFYVLALSWSPSYCDASRERGRGNADPAQCGERPYSFVVHGLWPQHERGFPAFCQVPAPRIPRTMVDSMLDLMPSPRLVFHEWDRHGTCSGLAPQAFFDSVRKARGLVKIPAEFQTLVRARTVSPAEVEDAFIKANPGLSRAGMAVACDGRRLNEVRVCLNKDFGFRDCAAIARRSCRSANLVMPPVRGGKEAAGERANNGQASDTPMNTR